MADTVGDLEKAVEAFVAKYDLCEGAITGAFAFQQNHGLPYSGPNFGEELKALRAALSAHKAAPDGWRPMPAREQPGVFPFTGERLLLCWEAFSSIPAHVELGRWRSGTGAGSGWCNTYGHSFASTPTLFMPLPSPPALATKEKGNG